MGWIIFFLFLNGILEVSVEWELDWGEEGCMEGLIKLSIDLQWRTELRLVSIWFFISILSIIECKIKYRNSNSFYMNSTMLLREKGFIDRNCLFIILLLDFVDQISSMP